MSYKLDRYLKRTATEKDKTTDTYEIKWLEFQEWFTNQWPEDLLRFIPKEERLKIFKIWLSGNIDKARKKINDYWLLWAFYMKELTPE